MRQLLKAGALPKMASDENRKEKNSVALGSGVKYNTRTGNLKDFHEKIRTLNRSLTSNEQNDEEKTEKGKDGNEESKIKKKSSSSNSNKRGSTLKSHYS